MAPLYKPPVQVVTIQMPFKVVVLRADPDFERAKRREPFYEFSNGRRFDENTALQGPYSTKPPDNP